MRLIRKIWNAILPAVVQPDPLERADVRLHHYVVDGWRIERSLAIRGERFLHGFEISRGRRREWKLVCKDPRVSLLLGSRN